MAKNDEFGKAIVRLRKEKGLTQRDLADRLNVSDKAVSRWETGKNYPDIETLQRLAAVLEVQVDDLLKGDLKLSKKNSSLRKIVVITLIIAILLYVFPFYNWISVTGTNYYGAREASYLLFRGLPGYHFQVSDIKKTARSAFSELGLTEQEAKEKYGELSRYCIAKDLYPNVVSEKHNFRILSVMLNLFAADDDCSGYMWVYYNQEGLDESGEIDTGGWKIYSLWYLDKDKNGKWYVKDIKEMP